MIRKHHQEGSVNGYYLFSDKYSELHRQQHPTALNVSTTCQQRVNNDVNDSPEKTTRCNVSWNASTFGSKCVYCMFVGERTVSERKNCL